MASPLTSIRNFFSLPKKEVANEKNLSGYIVPVQLQRLRQDVLSWRDAISEAERAYYPHRVKMMRMYYDTVLHGHVLACVKRRKQLTLLRECALVDTQGNALEQYNDLLRSSWFRLLMEYILDARFFGYSLIALGDMEDYAFPHLSMIKRHNIAPDRQYVGSFPYAPDGVHFLDEPYSNWHIWIPTPSDMGITNCGFGLLYSVAMYEIICRNLLGQNATAAELYGMPTRVGKTQKTDENERAQFEAALASMGSSGYIVLDGLDELELLAQKGSGEGSKIYADLEQRCEKKISKIILGHADALDSIPGKLGGGSGEESPVSQALEDIQQEDAIFLEAHINGQALPKLRALGFRVPENITFKFVNNHELDEQKERQNANNKLVAEIAQTMKNAGLQMDAKYFEEQTGIPTKEAATASPIAPPKLSQEVQNKLKMLYE